MIDGCPARLPLDASEIQLELDRRRPGQSRLTTPRQEADRAEILSGVFEGRTLGTPILVLVRNEDATHSSTTKLTLDGVGSAERILQQGAKDA